MTKETEKKYKVAVYGSLRKKLHNHPYYLGGNKGKYLGEFRTNADYTMYDLGSFPGILEEGNTPIHMEVYEVNLNDFVAINNLEGYDEKEEETSFYIRKKINSPFGKVYIYIYNTNVKHLEDKDIVETGNWKNYYLNKNKSHV